MSEEQRNYKNSEDEIDLRQLFRAIGDFFKGIGRGIENTIIRIRRRTIQYKWIIAVTLILGVAASVLLFNIKKPVYSSSMLLSSDYFNGRIVDNSIEKLNLLCEEEDRIGLSRALGVDQEVALNIVGFEAEPFISEEDRVEIEVLKEKLSELDIEDDEIQKVIERIEVENKNTFQIKINVNKSEVIDGLQPAVVSYFRNNSYIKNRIANNEQRLKERLVKLEQEDKKLDSLKRALIRVYESIGKKTPDSNGSDNFYIGEQYTTNPVDVFNQDARVHRELIQVREDLFLKKDFEVIDGLTVFRKPASAGLVETVFYGFLISLGLAYFIIMLLSINQYLGRIEAKRFS